MYQVELVKPPAINDFRADFFPRKFRYKSEATALVVEVANKGGEAKITRIPTERSSRQHGQSG